MLTLICHDKTRTSGLETYQSTTNMTALLVTVFSSDWSALSSFSQGFAVRQSDCLSFSELIEPHDKRPGTM